MSIITAQHNTSVCVSDLWLRDDDKRRRWVANVGGFVPVTHNHEMFVIAKIGK